jgi:hypothetical protein
VKVKPGGTRPGAKIGWNGDFDEGFHTAPWGLLRPTCPVNRRALYRPDLRSRCPEVSGPFQELNFENPEKRATVSCLPWAVSEPCEVRGGTVGMKRANRRPVQTIKTPRGACRMEFSASAQSRSLQNRGTRQSFRPAELDGVSYH